MRKVSVVMMAGVFALLVAGSAYAKEGKKGCPQCGMDNMEKSAEKWHEKRLDKMAKKLDLSTEQKDKISAIMKENGEKMKAEMEKMRESHKAMREENQKKMNEVLTPEQQKKFAEMKPGKHEKTGKHEKKCKGMKKGCRHGDEE